MAKGSSSSSSSRASGMAAERSTNDSSKSTSKESTRGANTSVAGKTPASMTPSQLAASFGGKGESSSKSATPSKGGLKSDALNPGSKSSKDLSIGDLSKGISTVIGSLLSGLTGQPAPAAAKGGLSAKANTGIAGLTGNKAVVANEMAKAGYSKTAIAAAIGRLSVESYDKLDPKARNKGDAKNGTDSVGIAQWNQGRLANLNAFSKANGLKPDTIEAQAKFFVHELDTTHKQFGEQLRSATDTKSAVAAMLGYEAPKGYSKANPWGVPSANETLSRADKTLGMLGDGAPVSSKTAPSPSPFGYMFGQKDPAPGTGKVSAVVNKDSTKMQSNPIETALKFALDPVGTAFGILDKIDFSKATGADGTNQVSGGLGKERPGSYQDPVAAAPSVAAAISPVVAATTENPLLLRSQRKPFYWSNIKVL